MELQLVSFEQAKALKELGFPHNKFKYTNYYTERKNIVDTIYLFQCASLGGPSPTFLIAAPTLELVAKWLREEKNIYIEIRRLFAKWGYRIEFFHKTGETNPHIGTNNIYLSYEEALSAGIDKAIEILNTK